MTKKVLGWALLLIGAWCGIAGFLGMGSDQFKEEAYFEGMYGNNAHNTVSLAFVSAVILIAVGIIALLYKKKTVPLIHAGYCPHCGVAVNQSQNFCSSCGQAVTSPAIQMTSEINIPAQDEGNINGEESLEQSKDITIPDVKEFLLARSSVQKVTVMILAITNDILAILFLLQLTGVQWAKDLFLNNIPAFTNLEIAAKNSGWLFVGQIAFCVFFWLLIVSTKKVSDTLLLALPILGCCFQIVFYLRTDIYKEGLLLFVALISLVVFLTMYLAKTGKVNAPNFMDYNVLLMLVIIASQVISFYKACVFFSLSSTDDVTLIGKVFSHQVIFILSQCASVVFYYNIFRITLIRSGIKPQQSSPVGVGVHHG